MRLVRTIGALVVGCALVVGNAAPAPGAGSTTTVSMNVPSATDLNVSACAPGLAGVTSFGAVTPGTSSVSSADCVITWGSSNDTAMLRAFDMNRVATAMDSSRDGSFGNGGVVTTPFGAGDDQSIDAALQPDGKVVAVGGFFDGAGYDFAVARYNGDGSLDTSFSGDGKASVGFGGSADIAHGVLIQPDGKIVLAGSTNNGSNVDIALARYNADGSLDASFGGGGAVVTAIGTSDDRAIAIAMDSGGKLLAAGYSRNAAGNHDFAVLRYNADGSLDSTFDSDGVALTPIGTGNDRTQDLVVQADGKIVVAGYAVAGTVDFAMARYNADGSLDTSFSGDGILMTSVGASVDQAHALIQQADGKLVAAGMAYSGTDYDMALARYNPDGSLDTGFGASGTVVTPVGAGLDRAFDVAVQSDGKLLVSGDAHNGADLDIAVVRYRPDGSLDPEFNANGKVTTAVGGDDYGRAMVVQPDGRIVAVGMSYNGANLDFALTRHTPNPAIVPDFESGVNDWTNGTGMFGACLREASGTTAGWLVNSACTAANGGWWNPIADTPSTAGAKVAATTAPGTVTTRLRFGLRTGAAQAPGDYAAPVVFEVIAPAA